MKSEYFIKVNEKQDKLIDNFVAFSNMVRDQKLPNKKKLSKTFIVKERIGKDLYSFEVCIYSDSEILIGNLSINKEFIDLNYLIHDADKIDALFGNLKSYINNNYE